MIAKHWIVICTSILTTSALLAQPNIEFPPQKQAMKIVFDPGGGDIGDFAGYGSKLLAYLGDFGVNMTRVGAGWGQIEQVRGNYDWAEADSLVNFLYNRNVDMELTIIGSPDWARFTHPDDEQRSQELGVPYVSLDLPKMENLQDLSNWAEALAAHFKGKVRYYEWWNEPDGIAGPVLLRDSEGRLIGGKVGGNAVHYAHTLKAVHDGLKRGNPDAILAGGSLSVFNTDFLEAIYATVGNEAFDAITIHPYSNTGVEIPWIEALRTLCVRYGHLNCEFWVNEYSWNEDHREKHTTTYGIGPGAEQVPEDGVSLCAKYPYITQVLLHTLNDWGGGDYNPESPNSGFGMITQGLKRKPKYESFREAQFWRRDTLSRELTLHGPHVVFPETDFELSFDPSAARSIDKADWSVPEGWSVRPGNTPHSFIFRAPADSTSPRPYPLTAVRGDGTAFTRYVEVVEPLQLSRATLKTGANGSSPAKIEMAVINLSDKPLHATPKLDLPPGWTCLNLEEKIVQPGPATWELLLKAPADAQPGVSPCKTYILRNGRQYGEYEFQIAVEALAPQITNRHIDGDLSDWTDAKWIPIPGDASPAKFSAAWNSQFLFLACQVDDDMHVQTMRPQEFWREDGIQIAIDAACDAVPGSLYSFNDQELQVALLNENSIIYRLHAPQGTYGGELKTALLKILRTSNKTTYELALPWSEIQPAQPKPDTVIGLTISINDKDSGDRVTSSWGHGILSKKAPARFGRLRLVN